jgi:hypothetical protein
MDPKLKKGQLACNGVGVGVSILTRLTQLAIEYGIDESDIDYLDTLQGIQDLRRLMQSIKDARIREAGGVFLGLESLPFRWKRRELVEVKVDLDRANFSQFSPFTSWEHSVNYKELIKRAKGREGCILSHTIAEHLVKNPGRIPEDWDSFCVLFLGTDWTDASGLKRLTSIAKRNGCWEIEFCYRDAIFRSNVYRLPCLVGSGMQIRLFN